MNEAWWIEIVKQVPALVLFLYMVNVFLKHMAERDNKWEKVQDKATEKLAEMNDSAKEFQRAILNENAILLNKTAQVIESHTRAVEKNSYILERITPLVKGSKESGYPA